MAAKWKINDRIALKDQPQYKGVISQVMPLYDPKDRQMYSVKWDHGVSSFYYDDLFVSEKEANELLKVLEKKGDGFLKGLVEKVAKIGASKTKKPAKKIKTAT